MATKTTKLENYLRWRHSSTAATCRRLWELCIKYRGFASVKEFHYFEF